MSDIKLAYGIDPAGKLRHVLDVQNGLSCQCHCPGCGAPLVAKNGGANVMPHFAHANGMACSGAHESMLHLLAKEILAEEKAIMLPPYGFVYEGCLQRFSAMEIEQRTDYSMLQPDVVGVQKSQQSGRESRLWIEIKVTHEVGSDKYLQIKQLNIACIEVDLSKFTQDDIKKEDIKNFLLKSTESRYWINNPVLERQVERIRRERREYAQQYAQQHAQQHVQSSPQPSSSQPGSQTQSHRKEDCILCPNHSTRTAILREMKMLKLPNEYRQLIMRYPLSWFEGNLTAPHPVRPTDFVLSIGKDTLYLPTSSPDPYGREVNAARLKQNCQAIHFFQQTLPQLVKSGGSRCQHIIKHIPNPDGSLDIICALTDT